ncbi:phosphoglycolate phosphatase [Alkanindiges hydrocarboniclasticus]|uniref:Phosphoglycolate phosphatase n=1 Tax=Alkanindiges hydrocarboniclasticus TaxID=1907941 RepID=A0A1S8CWW7_9GAMM|nr:HAD-IA family hydrolase [Alkanindiges hydrocarboniclasticus]ONG41332.1 phosphoglycolate phosphatase [Alkanindiges hydrocarboniclasticus]
MRAVLFDLDGTLIDTAPDFIRIIGLMCEQAQIQVPTDDLIRAQVSEGARAMVNLIYPDLEMNSPELLQMRQQFLEIYAQNIAVDTCLFPQMEALLSTLEELGLPWGIVTNKPRSLSELLLAALNLTERCQVLVCPDDVTRTKPDPEPMLLAASQLDLPPGQIVYVGDHPRDIDAGRAAGMPTVLAAYGYLPPDHRDDLDAWHADHIVYNVDELIELIHQSTHHLLTEQG